MARRSLSEIASSTFGLSGTIRAYRRAWITRSESSARRSRADGNRVHGPPFPPVRRIADGAGSPHRRLSSGGGGVSARSALVARSWTSGVSGGRRDRPPVDRGSPGSCPCSRGYTVAPDGCQHCVDSHKDPSGAVALHELLQDSVTGASSMRGDRSPEGLVVPPGARGGRGARRHRRGSRSGSRPRRRR